MKKQHRQVSLFEEAPALKETRAGQEFLTCMAGLEASLRESLDRAMAGNPSDENVRAYVAVLLKVSSEVFVRRLSGLDPKWYLTLANAMLTVAAHGQGVKVPCPLFPAFLPQEARLQLEEAGLLKPGEPVV